MRRASFLLLLLLLAPLATAQDPPPPVGADTLSVPPEPPLADTRPERAEPVLLPPGPPPGAGLTGVPARRSVFGAAALFDHVPAAWRYDLGVFGAPDGVAFGLTPPHRAALTLDGRPADDLFTGRPAFERLPVDLLAPFHSAPGLFGAPAGLEAHTRAFVGEVPITELRYRAGPDGQQAIGVTHAQTRRPAFVQRLGGELARLSALLHVSGDRAGGTYTNSEVGGFHLVARVGLSLPGMALEVTQRHLQREEGAWGGVSPQAPNFFQSDAPVRDPFAQREAIHNDLALRVRMQVHPALEPVEASLYWTASTHRYHRPDTTSARGHRLGGVVRQRLEVAGHRLTATADLRAGLYRLGEAFDPTDRPLAPEAHVTLVDTFDVGPLEVGLLGGLHGGRDFAYPSARGSVGGAAGPFSARAGAYVGGAPLSPVERLGFGDLVVAGPLTPERHRGVEGRMEFSLGPVRLELAGELRRTENPRSLVVEEQSMSARFVSLDGALTRALLVAGLHFRADATRGLYASIWGAGQRTLDADRSPLHRLEADAVPEAYAHGRLGVRAAALFDAALDLDAYIRGRAWSEHGARAFHPPTALFGLPEDAALPRIPASATLDVVLEAGIGHGRARAFLAYQNALSGLAYPGVFVVPIYPMPEPGLRAGIFWVLAN